jgi:hypothetical protein
MPAILALDQRHAPQRTGRILPPEGEVDLLTIMNRAHLNKRFSGAAEIGALLFE